MFFRTDLALEMLKNASEAPNGVTHREEFCNDISVSYTKILDDIGAKHIGKPIGDYITITLPTPLPDTAEEVIAKQLSSLLPKGASSFLVLGLGNRDVTPDALGPKVAENILATRHIGNDLATKIGLKGLKSVAVLSPGVLSQTGLEVSEILTAVVKNTKPDAVIVIDALAARSIKRLGCTVQITNTGITPGAGVGNARKEISQSTLNTPVISIGIPTVVDASTLVYDLTGKTGDGDTLIVTPKDIDTMIFDLARLLGHSINAAIQSEIDSEILHELV